MPGGKERLDETVGPRLWVLDRRSGPGKRESRPMAGDERTDFLWRQFLLHTKLFFTREAQGLLQGTEIVFLPLQACLALKKPAIAIPNDLSASLQPIDAYAVRFNDTHVTLWNRIPRPPRADWHALPDDNSPVWYQNPEGTLIPAWNLFGNLVGLLTLGEEEENTTRDPHGRFLASMSPRCNAGLLEVPAFNEAMALLVAACHGLNTKGVPSFGNAGLVEPPALILSHDLDVLRGNDFWTQSVRLYRTVRPLLDGKPPAMVNLHWLLASELHPLRYYCKEVASMMNIEKECGYTSSFYFINGRGGRFGARYGSKMISEALRHIPEGWEIGIHYNYDTFRREERLRRQVQDLKRIVGRELVSGHAHYLRFDHRWSFDTVIQNGIAYDESLGYPDRIGYRCGVAGCFTPFNQNSKAGYPVMEFPLAVMDVVLAQQYPNNQAETVQRMLLHLSRIGGALTLLVHSGHVSNPEFPESVGVYEKILKAARRIGVRGMSASALLRASV